MKRLEKAINTQRGYSIPVLIKLSKIDSNKARTKAARQQLKAQSLAAKTLLGKRRH